MKELTRRQALPLLTFLRDGMTTMGVIASFVRFGEKNTRWIGKSAREIARSLKSGDDFETSIKSARPKLPRVIEDLLVFGGTNSVLDYVLADICDVMTAKDESGQEDSLVDIFKKYRRKNDSVICDGCFERDFAQLLARARTEKATEVLLEQDREKYFHQKFLSDRLVRVSEACHSLVIRTFFSKLEHCSENSRSLRVSEEEFRVEKGPGNSFVLFKEGQEFLKIEFKRSWRSGRSSASSGK